MENKIEIHNMNLHYGDFHALHDINLDIKENEITAFIGPSGCGKSTLLRSLNRMNDLVENCRITGDIMLDGQDIYKNCDVNLLRRRVGMVFQNYALYPHLTVRKNIMFPLENLKGKDRLSKEEMEKRVLDAAKMVSLEELLDRKPRELSGGQQQRVAIARALVKMPRVLLLDEPLSNLDARLRLQTREEIRRIQRETKITTIFVTHDQEEALSISDLIVVMKEGILQQIGKPQEVYDQPANLFVAKFLGTPPINVFSGKVTDGQVKIGEETVLLADLPDQEVTVGIRPEGFVVDEDGTFSCALKGIEVLGRDISIVASHPAAENASIRAIVGSTRLNQDMAQAVFFSLKTDKVFLFDAKDGSRIETVLKRPAGKRS